MVIRLNTVFRAYLCQVDSSTTTLRTGLFLGAGCLVSFLSLLCFIYVKWTLLQQLLGPVCFQEQGVWLVFIITMFYRNSSI